MFLRLAGCNLQCVDGPKLARELRGREIDVGFFCDTDFAKGERMTLDAIRCQLAEAWPDEGRAVVISGGEPALQVDSALVAGLQEDGWYVAIETNGTIDNPAFQQADWISCSPKGRTELKMADEVRFVLEPGNAPDDRGLVGRPPNGKLHRFVSPRFESTVADFVADFDHPKAPDRDAMAWAVHWCLLNPRWRLSVQQHKLWGVE